MIVDCHTHIDFSEGGGLLSEHLTASETVDKCIVLAGMGSVDEVNQKLGEYVSSHKEKMTGFAYLEPSSEVIDTKKLGAITSKKDLSGVVLYCSACGFHPAHSRAMLFYEAAEELGLPVFFHNGPVLGSEAVLEYAQPILLDEIARRFRGLKMIIGDMGAPFVEQTLAMLTKHPNVYADLTISRERVWGIYNMVVSAHERKVMDKLFFGSGFPLGRADESIETLLGFNKLLGDTNLPTVPRGDIRNIIERDSLELLGIKK